MGFFNRKESIRIKTSSQGSPLFIWGQINYIIPNVAKENEIRKHLWLYYRVLLPLAITVPIAIAVMIKGYFIALIIPLIYGAQGKIDSLTRDLDLAVYDHDEYQKIHKAILNKTVHWIYLICSIALLPCALVLIFKAKSITYYTIGYGLAIISSLYILVRLFKMCKLKQTAQDQETTSRITVDSITYDLELADESIQPGREVVTNSKPPTSADINQHCIDPSSPDPEQAEWNEIDNKQYSLILFLGYGVLIYLIYGNSLEEIVFGISTVIIFYLLMEWNLNRDSMN